jgi:hypothetical protein
MGRVEGPLRIGERCGSWECQCDDVAYGSENLGLRRVEILRLRGYFASRSSYYAQDDNSDWNYSDWNHNVGDRMTIQTGIIQTGIIM